MRLHLKQSVFAAFLIAVVAGSIWRKISSAQKSITVPKNIKERKEHNESYSSRSLVIPEMEKNVVKPAKVEHAVDMSRKDFCSTSPCKNGATCRNYSDRHVCYCKLGFIGRNCEKEMDEKHDMRERLWMKTAEESKTKRRRLRYPDAIGIGVEKCGTDALLSFLKRHPMVNVPKGYPETQFFNAKYDRSISHYMSLMPEVADDEILVEKTPAYFNFLPIEVPFRIKKWIPKAKIILILCDPVNRTYSDFVHEKSIGGIWDQQTFDFLMDSYLGKYNDTLMKNMLKPDSEAFAYITEIHKSDPPSHILTTGLYYYHLLRWLEAFDSKNLYIMDGENFVSNPGIEIERLQDYLGLPKLLLKEDFSRNEDTGFFCFAPMWSQKMKISGGMYHHTYCLGKTKGRTRNAPKEASHEIITRLEEFYRPFNEKLFRLIRRKMNWQ